MSPFSVLVKLAAASFFGAAAFLAERKLRRDNALFSQNRDIRRRSSLAEHPPNVLVVGVRSHGKSSFINTACRVISGEEGPLVLRSETAPAGSPPGSPVTRTDRVIPLVCGRWWLWEESDGDAEDEVVVAEMVDTPGFSVLGGVNVKDDVVDVLKRRKAAPPECVVVVVQCPGADAKRRMGALRKLADMAGVVREEGLHLVIVLTHKHAMKDRKQAEELRKEAMAMARTDCVHLLENYTANAGHPFALKNNFDTHFNVLTIIRQCMEYSKMHRGHQQREKTASASSPPSK